jgi:hypothetical protein
MTQVYAVCEGIQGAGISNCTTTQPWPRLLAFKDGELLAKGEIFEHQTAARPKQAKHGSEPEPKQVKHGNQGYSRPTLPTALRSC